MLSVEVIEPLAVWGNSIRANLPSADDDAIVVDLEDTVNDFLRKSRTFDHELEIPLEAGKDTYPLNPVPVSWTPADTSFGGVYAMYVLYVLHGDLAVGLLNFRPHKAYWTLSTNSSLFAAWVKRPGELEILPTPTAANVDEPLRVRVSLTLTHPITNIPRFLADNYYEAVLHGTIGRMMSHVKRPYNDKAEAKVHLSRYQNELRIARDEAIRRWSSANAAFRFPSSWSRKTSGFMRI